MAKVGFVSLGCPKNLVDSEVMMGRLRADGVTLTPDPAEADVIVVNTCSFIDAAREESVDTILEMARFKEAGSCRRLVVAGCLVQRYAEELKQSLPEVDAFVGLDDLSRIGEIVGPALKRDSWRAGDVRGGSDASVAATQPAAPPGLVVLPASTGPATYIYDADTPRLLAGPSWSAYLKISEGCDNPCTFCAIPSFRGAYRSRRLGDIQKEAADLAARGVRELNLIAQDSTFYGRDLGFDDGPARLLRSLNEIDGLRWIRLFYLYPNRVSDSLLAALAECERVVNYVDIPLQSASRSVLGRMKRGGSRADLTALIERMRRAVPGLAVRTTFIVGFPGETDEEFAETLGFVDEVGFDRVGAFTYSHESGTEAGSLDDDVPAAVKAERQERLMEAQKAISLAKNQALVGRTVEVLCEGVSPETEHLLAGRMASQAPEIDGSVLINDGRAEAGEFVPVTITEAHPFDVVGTAGRAGRAGRVV